MKLYGKRILHLAGFSWEVRLQNCKYVCEVQNVCPCVTKNSHKVHFPMRGKYFKKRKKTNIKAFY